MREERRHPSCLNCGAPTPGDYCGSCGQRNADLHASFWELAADLLGEAFEADSRIGRTILPFVLKPGFLTVEHNAGRRVRYSSPLRLYLFCSFGFFLALSIGGKGAMQVGEGPGKGSVHVGFQASVTVEDERADGGRSDGGSDGGSARPDAGAAAEPDDDEEAPDAGAQAAAAARDGGSDDVRITGLGPLNRRLEDRVRELKQMNASKRKAFAERFGDEFFNDLPKAIFALLPIFALLLKLLFWRARRFYVEHLTFAFHVHAFAFLALLAPQLGGRPWTSLAATLAVLWYLAKALRTVYGQGWGWTAAKCAALVLVYFLFLSAAIAVVAVVGFLIT